MKTTVTKKTISTDIGKEPGLTINPSLNKHQGKVLFPKKLALAEKQLKGLIIPKDLK